MRASTILTLGLAGIAAAHNDGLQSFNGTGYITTKDDTRIFYKDSGNPAGQPVVFSHGWPLNSDNWSNQMFFLGELGYRVIAHDRRGHGRSSQPWDGNDMDHYADDLSTLFETLNLKNAIMVGHSTGGGEVARYLGRHGSSRVAKAVLVSSVTPHLVQSPDNPAGVPISTFDDFRTSYIANRAEFFLDVASGPFFGYDLPYAVTSQGHIQDWMQQGHATGFKNAYDSIKAFSETDFVGDMKGLTIPVLLVHGSADEIVPINSSALVGIKLLKKGQLKIYEGAPHAIPQINTTLFNNDLLAFIKQ